MFEELKMKLTDELDRYSRKENMNASDLDLVHKLTDTVKNICKIRMMEEAEEYQGDDSRAAYRSMQGRDRMGRYTSRDDRSYHEDWTGTRRGYSRDGAKEYMTSELEDLMSKAKTSTEREALRACIDRISRD